MDRLLDKKQLADYLGISVSGINSLLAHGELPAPLRIGYKIVRWRESDIMNYLESLHKTAAHEHDETRNSKPRGNLLQKTLVLKELLMGASLLYASYELLDAFFSFTAWV